MFAKNYIENLRFYGKINGLDFSTVVPVVELGLDESLVTKGSSSFNKYLVQLFYVLNITSNDRILDIGCFKGGGDALYD